MKKLLLLFLSTSILMPQISTTKTETKTVVGIISAIAIIGGGALYCKYGNPFPTSTKKSIHKIIEENELSADNSLDIKSKLESDKPQESEKTKEEAILPKTLPNIPNLPLIPIKKPTQTKDLSLDTVRTQDLFNCRLDLVIKDIVRQQFNENC